MKNHLKINSDPIYCVVLQIDISSVVAVVEELQAHDSTIVNSMEIVPMDDDSLIQTPKFPRELNGIKVDL